MLISDTNGLNTADARTNLARHGALRTWPLDRFVAALLDGRDIDAATADFRRLADQGITAETGQPTR